MRVAVAGAVLLSLGAGLTGCQYIWPDQFTSYEKISRFVDDLELSQVGSVVATGNTAEGLGNSLIHEFVVFENADAGDRLRDLLEDEGFETPSDTDGVVQVWKLSSDGAEYTARILPIDAGESMTLSEEDGVTYTAPVDALAVDFYTSR
jgi:hypothetical protein